jgi:hypothetical protein
MSNPRDEIWIDMVHFDTRAGDALWDGEAPRDAPVWYAEVAAHIRSARAVGHPAELSDEPHVVASMRRAALGDTGVQVQRPASRRTVGRVVAMKASAIATAGVIGITTAAATIGTVVNVVVPAIENQFVTSGPEQQEDEGSPATDPSHRHRGAGAPVTGATERCDVQAGSCIDGDVATNRATSTDRGIPRDDAGRHTGMPEEHDADSHHAARTPPPPPAAALGEHSGGGQPSEPVGPAGDTGSSAHPRSDQGGPLLTQGPPPATTAPTEGGTRASKAVPSDARAQAVEPDRPVPAARGGAKLSAGTTSSAGPPGASQVAETPAAQRRAAGEWPPSGNLTTPTVAGTADPAGQSPGRFTDPPGRSAEAPTPTSQGSAAVGETGTHGPAPAGATPDSRPEPTIDRRAPVPAR